MDDEEAVDIRMMVSQDDHAGNGFVTHLVLGKPTTLKLAAKEKAVLNFKLSTSITVNSAPLTLNLQYFTGNASVFLVTDIHNFNLLTPSDHYK